MFSKPKSIEALDRQMERALLGRLSKRGQAVLSGLLGANVLSGIALAFIYPGIAGLALLFPLMVVCFFRGVKGSILALPLLVFHLYLVPGFIESAIAIAAAATGVSFSAVTAYKYRLARQQELKMEEDLKLAKEVQSWLLPRRRTRLGPLEIVSYTQASRELGGDFLCFSHPGEGRYGLLIGDIMGKGTQAALTAAMLDGVYAELTQTGAEPKVVLQQLNRYLTGRFGEGNRMATLFCLELDTVRGVWRHARAGHPPPLLVRADGSYQQLSAEGLMAGVMASSEYRSQETDVAANDQLLLVTDGLLESEIPAQDTLAALLCAGLSLPVDQLQQHIIEELRRHLPMETEDDETAALVRFLPR